MTLNQIYKNICFKKSFLCIGLDSDLTKLPPHLLKCKDPIFEFNKQIIDATHDLCIAYKPNIAFYEILGSNGWETLKQTIDYIPKEVFTIADAKRGDIGNSSKYYAKTFFETYNFDALTLSPYMGKDSIEPFLCYPGKWAIILAVTSNEGAYDFQLANPALNKSSSLYETVLKKSSKWGTTENTMFVVGATHPEIFTAVRAIVPHHFLLVPGIGAQGGDLNRIAKFGMNPKCGLIVNASRSIIYAGSGTDFAKKAREQALILQKQMEILLNG